MTGVQTCALPISRRPDHDQCGCRGHRLHAGGFGHHKSPACCEYEKQCEKTENHLIEDLLIHIQPILVIGVQDLDQIDPGS